MLMPALRRSVFEPLWLMKNKSALSGYHDALQAKQYASESTLRDEQFEGLVSIIDYAYKNTRYYHESFQKAGVKPSDIMSPADLSKVPILTKHDIRNNYDAILSKRYDKKDLLCFKTGGSTGSPLEVFISQDCSQLRNAYTRRNDGWTGWRYGEAVGAVWGNTSSPSVKERAFNFLLLPFLFLDTMNMTEQSVEEFCRQWVKVRPTLLFGHSHSLFILAKFVENLEIHHVAPKGIISSSMTLLENERLYIESIFNTKVFNRYGCEEVSLIAAECEKHEGLHMNIENLYIEVLRKDGVAAEPGEEGCIVVTDLRNEAMPLIRYSLEDVGVICPDRCSCGRGLPMFSSIKGRVADFLIGRKGELISGISLIENTLTKYPGIEQMQLVQNPTEFVVRVVPANNFSTCTEKALESYFQDLFGGHTFIEKVDRIEQQANGKYRFSICNIRQ